VSIKIERNGKNGGTVTIVVDGSSSVSGITICGDRVVVHESWWSRFKRWFRRLFR
jgi:hypothetical protein